MIPRALQDLPPASKLTYTLVTIAVILLIGAIDYWSGIEYRVFPLYFLPLSLAAWRLDRGSMLVAALSCTLLWIVVNDAAGLHFSSPKIWIFNATTLFCSFVAIGHLIGQLRLSAERDDFGGRGRVGERSRAGAAAASCDSWTRC